MFRRFATLVWLAALVLCGTAAPARAHGIVGKRLFIEPLFTEDANPKTELEFPVFESIHIPEGHYSAFNYSLENKLSSRFSVGFDNSYNWSSPNGQPGVSGFDNVGFGAKYAIYKSPVHDFSIPPPPRWAPPPTPLPSADRPFAPISP